jgi:hypothetical protein
MNFVEYVHKRDLNKKLIDTFGQYKVYFVNGEEVRKINQSIHEFTDYALHKQWPDIIPENEIWIDEVTKRPNDLEVVISQALSEQKYANQGYKDAYNRSLKRAKKMREILDGFDFHPKKPSKEIYQKKYGTIGDGTVVWLVNGEIVRDEFKTDYVEGGNSGVYPWVPEDEIWIEDTMHSSEIPIIILHEFVERELMDHKHFDYLKAHRIASKVEFKREGKFDREDALGLNKEKALGMAKEFV